MLFVRAYSATLPHNRMMTAGIHVRNWTKIAIRHDWYSPKLYSNLWWDIYVCFDESNISLAHYNNGHSFGKPIPCQLYKSILHLNQYVNDFIAWFHANQDIQHQITTYKIKPAKYHARRGRYTSEITKLSNEFHERILKLSNSFDTQY